MMKKTAILFILLTIGLLNLKAQEETIVLSGAVKCSENHKESLSFVNVYNKNTKAGDVTDAEGKFSIEMGRNDTILFSTVQHTEQKYYIKEGEFFYDKIIEIDLQQDTIWLKTVSVMGFKEYEEFKEEVIQLKLPQNDISYALPTIDKYAKQNATGEGAIELKEPLTYLFRKINLLNKRSKNKLNQE